MFAPILELSSLQSCLLQGSAMGDPLPIMIDLNIAHFERSYSA
jgi:hypothetical protein